MQRHNCLEPLSQRRIVNCATQHSLALSRKRLYLRGGRQLSIAELPAFLGRFLPKLGGAVRCRPFFCLRGRDAAAEEGGMP
jgi:hypothetical protein